MTRLSEEPPGEVNEALTDTGDALHVPEEERLDHDDFVEEEVNEDELQEGFAEVPDGEYVELETADLDDEDEADDEEVE